LHQLGESSALAEEAARNYKNGHERQIVLIGHSSGGTAILTMAEELGRAGVPVALAISIDAPRLTKVSSNVRRVINLYLSNGVGVAVERGPKFHGELKNVDLKNDAEMGHFSIQSSDKIHKQLIGYVLGAIGGSSIAAAQPQAQSQATLR
jgi:hypothetical protein